MERWRIAVLVSAAIAISYLDRQTLPVAVKAITLDIPLSNEQFSYLQSAFLLAYALMYAGGGRLADALGTRRGFFLIMLFWSIACASHGFALNFAMLAGSRFLLGVGEGGGFPAATRAVAEWFPVNERATAMGIINAGTAAGAVVAPPLIAGILLVGNWRWIFFATGAIGLAWAIGWRLSYADPQPGPTETRSAQLEENRNGNIQWPALLLIRETWGLVLAKFLSDAAWYFYLFWLPKYLYDARGFDIKAVGQFAWIPYAASGIGSLVGGGFSSYLVKRRLPLGVARKIALGLSAAVMPCVFLIPHVPITWALALFSIAYFGQQSWSTLVMVLPTDLFPRAVVGSVAGLVGFGGAMGGIAFGQLVGYMLDHGSGYGPVFAMAGSFHVVAFFIILLMIPVVGPFMDKPPLRLEAAR
ncbi:MAG TPA: MFS transporter [Terriglobales bacterium]|nr:MFS transporter [Terriglobales bacterium]